MVKVKSKTLCKNCKKETFNQTTDWTGFCSKKCEK